MNKLYLASQSFSRRYLLTQARIPFMTLNQTADEGACDWNLPIDQVVLSIARHKMNHVIAPEVSDEGDTIFVVTADTLCQDINGVIHGKPADYQDACAKARALSAGPVQVVTAFCVEKKQVRNGAWVPVAREERVVAALCYFEIPESWIETYFKEQPIALQCAGALAIEEYGLQFLKKIEGSYTGIIGLPLYELRESLDRLGFYKN